MGKSVLRSQLVKLRTRVLWTRAVGTERAQLKRIFGFRYDIVRDRTRQTTVCCLVSHSSVSRTKVFVSRDGHQYALMMEAVSSPETSVRMYQTTRRSIPKTDILPRECSGLTMELSTHLQAPLHLHADILGHATLAPSLSGKVNYSVTPISHGQS
jgi:hypothetical protein